MRVWIDITGPAHVLVFRPLVEVLRARGAEVEITTREFSQNVELLRLHGMEAEVVGGHGGRSRVGKAADDGDAARGARPLGAAAAIRRRARAWLAPPDDGRPARCEIPSATTFDYEYATAQHQLGLPGGERRRSSPRRSRRSGSSATACARRSSGSTPA